MSSAGAGDPLRFAEKFLALLDSGRFTASYKFAVLVALIDVCVEGVDAAGRAPTEVPAKRVGEKVLALYWRQARPYAGGAEPRYLRQSTQSMDLVRAVADFRAHHGFHQAVTLEAARAAQPEAVAELERHVVTTVIRMPLPKLQRFATGAHAGEDRFLYDFSWPDEVAAGRVWAVDFDDTLRLRPGVGEWLVRMAGMLRPIVQQRWAAFVADRSRDVVEAAYLEEFLFGAQRVDLSPVRRPLLDLQHGRCFYCDRPSGEAGTEVDHFVPWARHPDNGLDNLVAAHRGCNNSKRESLAATGHLERWLERSADPVPLAELAATVGWVADRPRTLAAARASYLWLPDDTLLWAEVGLYEPADADRLRALLAGA